MFSFIGKTLYAILGLYLFYKKICYFNNIFDIEFEMT